MYILSNFVKVTVPNYLTSLPIPDSFSGWFRLGVRDWLTLLPPTLVIGGISYYSFTTIRTARRIASGQMNLAIRKDVKKVVDVIEIEDIAEKAVLCRCWRSKTWPYCDGAHGPYNRATGDNTGPLVVKRKDNNK